MVARSAAIYTHAPDRAEPWSRSSACPPPSSPRPSAWCRTISRRSSPTRRSRSSATCSWGRRGRVLGRHLPPGDARVLQGAAVPRRGQRDSRALRRAGPATNGRPAEEDPLDLLDHDVRGRWPSAGVPPFSGFFSKDEILVAAYHQRPWMYWVGVITAGMTAFYVFRAIFLAFFGEYRGRRAPARIARRSMMVPLAVLALLSLGGGSYSGARVTRARVPARRKSRTTSRWWRCRPAGGPGRHRPGLADVRGAARPGRTTLAGALHRRSTRCSTTSISWTKSTTPPWSSPSSSAPAPVLWKGFDAGLIDGAVNGVGACAQGIGERAAALQSGNIRSYATWVLLGSVLVIVAIGRRGRRAMNLLNVVLCLAAAGVLRCCCSFRRDARHDRSV